MFRERVKKFLKDTEFLPLTKWNSFEINHKSIPPKNPQEERKYLKKIRDIVSEKSGLYIYERNKKILYVGKGNPLFNRIKNHYVSSYREVPGDTKDKIWHRFFSFHSGKLKVYWKEQEDEKIRQIIEKMMDYISEPKFNFFREKIKIKKQMIK